MNKHKYGRTLSSVENLLNRGSSLILRRVSFHDEFNFTLFSRSNSLITKIEKMVITSMKRQTYYRLDNLNLPKSKLFLLFDIFQVLIKQEFHLFFVKKRDGFPPPISFHRLLCILPCSFA